MLVEDSLLVDVTLLPVMVLIFVVVEEVVEDDAEEVPVPTKLIVLLPVGKDEKTYGGGT